MVVHVLSVLFTGGILYLAVPGSDLFSWHPTCMTVGFILLLLQAIVLFSPESSLFPTTSRNEKVQLHWILHAFGLASAIFGFGTVYLNKEINNRKHFTTWHGTFGLITMVGALLAVLGGICANYSQSLKAYIRPINMKMYHATAGMLVFVLAMTSVALATYSNWFKNRVEGWPGKVALWVPIILAVCVARQVTESYLLRVLKPRESELDAKARKIQEKVEAKLRRKQEKKNQPNKSSDHSDGGDMNFEENIEEEEEAQHSKEKAA